MLLPDPLTVPPVAVVVLFDPLPLAEPPFAVLLFVFLLVELPEPLTEPPAPPVAVELPPVAVELEFPPVADAPDVEEEPDVEPDVELQLCPLQEPPPPLVGFLGTSQT